MSHLMLFIINKKRLAFVGALYIISVSILTYTFNTNSNVTYSKPTGSMKYILLWTSEYLEPFSSMGTGQEGFNKRNCSFSNCFVTFAKNYFGDHRKFHAVIFSVRETIFYAKWQLPHNRSPHQKFVISSIESSHYYPLCYNKFNEYFNWTWSFRLDSDCMWGYIAIRDAHGRVIGPSKIMHWIKLEDMGPVRDELRKSLLTKTKAAVWFVSNCYTKSQRELVVQDLQTELANYNHKIDIYGFCGNFSCPRGSKQCMEMIERDYYFYLAFENSMSTDYVTEKLLYALRCNAIPVVYGYANYTRFMPDGIYLNAHILGPAKLAQEIDFLIRNPEKYADYFRWKNHYSYHSRDESEDTDDICAFCKMLNDEEKLRQKSVIKNFREWWNSPRFC